MSEQENGLCANPDCVAFFDRVDREPVRHLDKDSGCAVSLCLACTADFAKRNNSRYQRLTPGASEHE